MTRNRQLWWALAAIGALGLSFALSRLFILARPTVRPFTLTTETYSPHGAAPDQPIRHEVVAVRSDGAQSTTSTRTTALRARETLRAISFPDGSSATIYYAIAAKTTSRYKVREFAARRIARLAAPPPDCAIPGWLFVGYDTIAGRRVARLVAGWRLHTSGGFGWYVIEWHAPEVGCTSLASKTYDPRTDGSPQLSREQRFVSLKLGEPDPAVFDVPTDYREMKPSDAAHALASRYGERLNADQEKFYQDQDRFYLFGIQGLRPNGRYWRDALPAPGNKFR